MFRLKAIANRQELIAEVVFDADYNGKIRPDFGENVYSDCRWRQKNILTSFAGYQSRNAINAASVKRISSTYTA